MNGINIKRLTLVLSCLFLFVQFTFSQTVNALFLRDGSMVLGTVMEWAPSGDVKIQSTDGNIQSFPVQNIQDVNWSYLPKKPGPGQIYRYGEVFRWKHSNLELTDRNFKMYFDDDLYHTYIRGRNQLNIGGGCCTIGVACVMLMALNCDYHSSLKNQSNAFYAYGACADVLLCLGCVFTEIAKSRLNWVEKTFNDRLESNDLSSTGSVNTFRLNPSLMLTAQRDLAMGATMSFSF